MKNYKLTSKTIVYHGVTLHQIQALRDFNGVKAGELGGWIEREINLQEMGWIAVGCVVCGKAIVKGYAWEGYPYVQHGWIINGKPKEFPLAVTMGPDFESDYPWNIITENPFIKDEYSACRINSGPFYGQNVPSDEYKKIVRKMLSRKLIVDGIGNVTTEYDDEENHRVGNEYYFD